MPTEWPLVICPDVEVSLMPSLTRSKPEAPEAPAAVVPGRLGPPRWLQAAVMSGQVAALVISATRPARVSPTAQRVADTTSAVVLAVHPLEAAAVRRYGKRRGIAPSSRRRATFATLAFGAFAALPATRKIRKATR
jgi:hypothetical protein